MSTPDMSSVPRMEVTDEQAREIEAKLAAIASDEPYVAPEPVEEKTEEAVVETAPTQEEAAVEEKPDAPPAAPEPADEATDAPTLPDNIRRSLIATGWDDDEIDNNLKVLGEEFLPVADKVHQKRMDESREWAARGRMVTETEPKTETEEVSETLAPIQVANLKEKYGHDPDMLALIDEMTAPMNASIEAINQILPVIAEQRVHQAEATESVTRESVDAFFGSSGLASFEGFYGKGTTEVQDEQCFAHRMAVLKYADCLQVGATAQGSTISLSEAMGMAHDSVSGDFRMEALRAEMKNKMQQRAASVTLKPDSSGGDTGTPVAGEPVPQKTRAQMILDADVGLKKLFG